MPTNTKAFAAFAVFWIASVSGAYWVGGKREHAILTQGENVDRRGEAASGGGNAASLSALGDVDSERARSLSSSSSTAKRDGGVRASAEILHLLGGGSGTDIERSEFEELARDLGLDEVVDLIGQLAVMDPGPAQRDAYTEVLSRWAELDADAALEHVATIEAPKLRYDATINVLRHWAAVNPAAALAHVDANADDDLPNGSLSAVFRGIGNSTDTTAALEFIGSLEDEKHKRYAYDAVRELFERNGAEVIAWTGALPEGELRDHSVYALIDQWARYDPIAARAWVVENTSESNRAGALVELGESWARVDPESAVAWALTMDEPGSANNGKVLERVFRRWLEYDIASAAGFLVQQEPSPQLDGALELYIQRVKNVDPDATMAWAESISDPKRRRNAVLHVAKIWRSRDKQAYESYIESSDIFTEDERNKLLGREKLQVKDKSDKVKTKAKKKG